MSDHVIKLKEPIKHGSELITEFTVRKPKAKDLRGLPKDPNTGDMLNFAGRLCGQPPSVIDELGMEDVNELLEVVGNFMDLGQKTGSRA
jgi:hypothetical protein